MAATLKDIARETGLSIATVSKYINGIKLKEVNQIAIEEAIKKLNYTVNEYARGLKMNQSKTIGIIIPELSNIFITHIITKIEELLRANGYSAIICDCHSEEKLECEAVDFLLSKMVDGIINMPICMDGRHLLRAIEKNVPVVLIDRKLDGFEDKVDCVLIDNNVASQNATNYLVEKGHKDIGIIVGPKDIFTSKLRLNGYKKSLENHGIEYKKMLTVYSDYSVQGGYESLKKLWESEEKISAVYVTNYEMTLGAIIYANEKGIKIPEELSFIGFDNMELSKVVHPKLTIVTQPLAEIGTKVANIMLDRLVKKDKQENYRIILQSVLVEGDSVK